MVIGGVKQLPMSNIFLSDPTRSAGQFLNLFTDFKRTGFISSGQQQEFGTETLGTNVTVRSSNEPWQIVYGETRVGGVVTFASTDVEAGGEFLHLGVTIAGHEVEDVTELWLDDQLVTFTGGNPTGWAIGDWANLVFVSKESLGGHSVANTDLVAQSVALFPGKWTSAHIQQGRALVYLILKFDATIFPNGIPRIAFQAKGNNQIYDPRGPSTGYLKNAALIINNYITNTSYGLSVDYSTRVDETNLIEAANICDETINLNPSGTEARYEINGVFYADDAPRNVLSKMASAIAGDIVESNGLWRIYPGKWRAPVITLTEEDLRGPVTIATRASRQENFNAVQGQYVGVKNNYEPADYPVIKNDLYQSQDGGTRITQELHLPLTSSSSAAQRIAKIALERVRQSITVETTCSLKAYKALVKDNIQLSLPRFGWDYNTHVAHFTRANTERLKVADNTSLSITGNLTISCWVKQTSYDGGDYGIVSKYNSDTGQQSYLLSGSSNKKYLFYLYGTALFSDVTDTIPLSRWQHLVARYDGSTIKLYINNGTPYSAAHSGSTPDSTADFFLGAFNAGTAGNFDGNIRNVGIWDRALTADEIETLYNGGYPLRYTDLAQSMTSNLVSFWNLDEESDGTGAVTRADSHGTNHLTDENTVASEIPSDLSLGKSFEVQSSELTSVRSSSDAPSIGVRLQLKETAVGVYDWDSGEETIVDLAPNTTLPDPTKVIAPTGLILASGTDQLYIRSDGTIFSRIQVSWTSPIDPFVVSGGRIECQYKLSSDSTWLDATSVPGNTTTMYILDVSDSYNYDVRIRSVNGLGNASDYTQQLQHLVVGKTASPSNVVGLAAAVQEFGVEISWDAISDLDLSHYELRQGASWASATFLAEVKGTTYRWDTQTAASYTFLVKAIDTSGNESDTAASTATTITVPTAPTVIASIVGENLILSWSGSTSQFAIDQYNLYYGSTYPQGVISVASVKGSTFSTKITWANTRIFWVTALDVAGNEGNAGFAEVNIIPPGSVNALTADVIDNNVFLRWTAPTTGTLPVATYKIYKGDVFTSATFIGSATATFHARFEFSADVYTYWVTTVDSAGSTSPHKGISATVSAPPDFILREDSSLEPHYGGNSHALSGIDIPRIVARFVASDSQYFSIADNSDLSIGSGTDFTWVIRFKPSTIDAALHYLFNKYNTSTSTGGEYDLRINTSNLLEFAVVGGTTRTSLTASSFGALIEDEWITAICWYDDTAQKIKIQVANGTIDETAHTASINNSTQPFEVGRASTPGSYYDGDLSFLALWKRLLNSAERERLFYMGGALDYEALDAGLLTDIIACWDFDEDGGIEDAQTDPDTDGGPPFDNLELQVYDDFESGSMSGWWEMVQTPSSPVYSYPSDLNGEKVVMLQFDADEEQNMSFGDTSLNGGTGVDAIQLRFWQSFKSDYQFSRALKLCRAYSPTNTWQFTIELFGNGILGDNAQSILLAAYHDQGQDVEVWSEYSLSDITAEVQYDVYINAQTGIAQVWVDGVLKNQLSGLTRPTAGAKLTGCWIGGNYTNWGTNPTVLCISYIHRAAVWTAIYSNTIGLTGIASKEAFGACVLTGGNKTIVPTGISSAETFGALAVLGGATVPIGGSPQGGLTQQIYDDFQSGSVNGWWEMINTPSSPVYSYPSLLGSDYVLELQADSDEDQNMTIGDTSLNGGTGVDAIQLRFWQSFKSDYEFPVAQKLCRVYSPTNTWQFTVELFGNDTDTNTEQILLAAYHDQGQDVEVWADYVLSDITAEVQYDLYVDAALGVAKLYVDGTLISQLTGLTRPLPGAKLTGAWIGGNYTNQTVNPSVLCISYIHRASVFY